MTRPDILRPGGLFAAVALAGLLLAAPHPADAKGKAHAVATHLESLTVGPGKEFRLAVVHPLFGPKFLSKNHALAAASDALPDALGLTVRRTRVAMRNFQDTRLYVLPGEIMRAGADQAVLGYVVTDGADEVTFAIRRASDDPTADMPTEETRLLGVLLPPALRWLALDGGSKELRKAQVSWAKAAEAEEARRSPANLASAKLIAERVKSYEKAFATAAKPPAGTELVGYAALLDGEVAILESFGSADLAAPWWPKAMRALAVECALAEVDQELLAEAIPASGDPDRHIAKVKDRILSLYGPRPSMKAVKSLGREYRLEAVNEANARALVIEDSVAHLVVLIRPDRRGAPDPDEELGFGALSRKLRPTEADKRLVKRRKDLGDGTPGGQPTPPPTPPKPPPGPTPPPGEGD